MSKPNTDTASPADARSRLVLAALRLFAEKGYESTSTREICQAAQTNISSIRYYFGDKAGLYRAAYTECTADMPCSGNMERYTGLSIEAALTLLFKEFLEPLKKGEELRLLMKLHYREILEPTGVWQEQIDAEIKPKHDAVVAMLKQHFGLQRTDTDVHRLAFAIIGMAVHFYVGQDIVAAIAPNMIKNAKAIDVSAQRLTTYALAIIQAEALRRANQVNV